MSTITVALTTVECCNCGISYAIPEQLNKKALDDHKRSIYCPNGHGWHYIGETDAQREKRLRKYAEDEAAALRARVDQTEASLRATKGVVTRLRKRAITGTCAFCHRHFTDVERHMATKHPGEQP